MEDIEAKVVARLQRKTDTLELLRRAYDCQHKWEASHHVGEYDDKSRVQILKAAIAREVDHLIEMYGQLRSSDGFTT